MTSTLFCIDFDETLMNTDRLRAEQLEGIRNLGGDDLMNAYQEVYEMTRSEHGVPHLPLALKALFDRKLIDKDTHHALAELFHSFPYQKYLYTGAEEVLKHLKTQGVVLVYSDGNAFFQPQKIYSTTIKDTVDSIVVLPSKITSFDELEGYWPAEKYVFIDDKPKVLNAAKEHFGERAVSVWVRQGRYASTTDLSIADISVANIAGVTELSF